MRIISSFHDYYDSVQSQGQDLKLIYLREEKEVVNYPFEIYLTSHSNYFRHDKFGAEMYSRIVGFCGQIYPIIVMLYGKTSNKLGSKLSSIINQKNCYTIDEVIDFVKNIPSKHIRDEFFAKRKRVWGHYFNIKNVHRFLEDIKTENRYEKVFHDHNSPIFLTNCNKHTGLFDVKHFGTVTIFNPCLKDIEFYKVFDPYRAFQEIAMYLGGVLGMGNPPVPSVSNDDLIEAKGFDLKKSFRKEKNG